MRQLIHAPDPLHSGDTPSMNLYQKIAFTLWLALGLLLGAIALGFLATDLQFYRSMQAIRVTVQEVHLHSEATHIEDVGPAIELESELHLSTPDGERSVRQTETFRPDAARQRMAEIQALRGQTLTLYLSKDAPTRFAFQRAFNWNSTLALAFVLVFLILPPLLALVWHRKKAMANEPVVSVNA